VEHILSIVVTAPSCTSSMLKTNQNEYLKMTELRAVMLRKFLPVNVDGTHSTS